jgi:hypothetical protein
MDSDSDLRTSINDRRGLSARPSCGVNPITSVFSDTVFDSKSAVGCNNVPLPAVDAPAIFDIWPRSVSHLCSAPPNRSIAMSADVRASPSPNPSLSLRWLQYPYRAAGSSIVVVASMAAYGFGSNLPILYGLTASLILFVGVSLVTGPPPKEKLEQWLADTSSEPSIE